MHTWSLWYGDTDLEKDNNIIVIGGDWIDGRNTASMFLWELFGCISSLGGLMRINKEASNDDL